MTTSRPRVYLLVLLLTMVTVLFSIRAENPDGSRSGVKARQTAPAFEATTTDGKTVHFPGDYKGKVVLLDFWATWCPPCRKEVPNLVKLYNKYHAQGFEVLGVSLDKKDRLSKLQEFTQKEGMTWPQIYDGTYFDTPVAKKYGVSSIPCPVLVDGNTGMILAEGRHALNDYLVKLVPTALAKTKK